MSRFEEPVRRGDVLTYYSGDGHFAAVYDWNKGKWFLRLQWDDGLSPCFNPDKGYESERAASRWLWVAEQRRQQDQYNDDPPWRHPDRQRRS